MKRSLTFITIAYLLFHSTGYVFAQSTRLQEVGTPLIRNYAPREYKAYSQNWEVVQDKRGILYFANGDGLLEYDGVYWRLYPILNNYYVSSIAMDDDGTIYVGSGSGSEFGYFSPTLTGSYKYHSLMDKFNPKDRKFSFVLNIYITKYGIFFNTNDRVVRWYKNEIKVWKIGRPSNCFKIGDNIYIWQNNVGIRQIVGDAIKSIPGGSMFANINIRDVLPFSKNKFLFINRDAGMYIFEISKQTKGIPQLIPFPTEVDDFLAENRIAHATLLKNGNIALNTNRGGTVIIDKKGKLLQILNKNSGLMNETNYYSNQDVQQALWLATDNGITKAEIGSPLSFWNDADGIKGSIMATARFKGTLFVATWQGVYYLTKEKDADQVSSLSFKPVTGIASECWDIKVIKNPITKNDDKILVAATAGVFDVSDYTAKQISKGTSYKILQPVNDLNKIYIGKDDGINLLSFNSGIIHEEGKISTFGGKTLSMSEDHQGRVWAAFEFLGGEMIMSGNNGKKSSAIEKKFNLTSFALDTSSGFPSVAAVSIIEYNNKLLFITDKGIYNYSENADKFKPGKIKKDISYSSLFLDQSLFINNIRKDFKNNLWLQITSKKYGEKIVGLANVNRNGLITFNTIPFKPIPKMEIISIFPEVDGITWFGGDDGLFRYDANVKFEYNKTFHAMIRRVILEKDSVIFGGNYFSNPSDTTLKREIILMQPDEFKPRISYNYNSITFEFSSPSFYDESSNKFQYFLEGFDKKWSAWSSETKKEYTNLPYGTYKFHVKARNIFDFESTETIYEFTILPPWYYTVWAYIFYVIIFAFIIYASIQYSNRRLRAAKIRLEEIVKERTSEIVTQKKEIEKEKEKSDKLLLNILPFKIAEELKATGTAKAQHYDMVSVMFADFSGFTMIAEKMDPEELIDELDKFFVFFDEVCVRHNLEKIKTVGDSYMCAGGVPISNTTNPVDIVLAAMEMLAFIENSPAGNTGIKWQIRFGIHTGEIVAGVVGKNKFAYDIWGDTVNTASRLESSGEPNKINISGATYRYVKDFFDVNYRGKVAAKHKGEIDMNFVEGIKKELSLDEERSIPNKLFLEMYEKLK
jgi:class 3 adenylate cyclase/ligand-binding sensor domain-containing protein